jgi:hypothetical protein
MPENNQTNDTGQPQGTAPVPQPPKGQATSPAGGTGPLSFYELLRLIVTDPCLTCDDKTKLLNEIRKSGGVDRWTFRTAIWILGAVVLLSIGAIWALSASAGTGADKIPQGLVAIGSGAVGGLAG